MIKVKNRKAIKNLSNKSLMANKTRNIIAVAAIALTALLFTSLFTIALSINEGFQQSNFRQVGGWSHGGFKYLTEEQYNELKDDPLIKEYGLRRFLGMPEEEPFNKYHVEVGYSDAKEAHWMYCDPIEGRLPEEGTDEAATDTKVLELLGVEPKLGEKFTVTFDVDGKSTTQTFTLCGWWEYDEAIVANHILVPESRVDEVLDEVGVTPPGNNGMTGAWNMDVMFDSSFNIDKNIEQVLANHGYQDESMSVGDNYIATGVNWGYSASQLAESLDITTVSAIAVMLILIIFTGYLIIYNVFQISVAGDIRFYGLLKTIGTTPKQIKRIVVRQAFLLSLIGIPIGLILGWAVGSVITPVIIGNLDGIVNVVSINPLIFIISAVFALITVFISCHKPGRMASKVSPIEALRFTDVTKPSKKTKRGKGRVSVFSMAWANLGRNKGKTAITVISLSLSVVLLMITVSFTNGFDMNKYVSSMFSTDFQIAGASYFQTNFAFSKDTALSPDAVEEIESQEGITGAGKTYGRTNYVQEFVTEDYYRALEGHYKTSDVIDEELKTAQRNEEGLVASSAKLYGMEDFVLDKLNVLEGDISKLYEPGSRYIAAVYGTDDYGKVVEDSAWAKVGDTVKLRYAEEIKYYNPETGEEYPSTVDLMSVNSVMRVTKYREETYTVAALVEVPSSLSYRYYGDDEFVLNSDTFIQDSQSDAIMYYAFDTDDVHNDQMEEFLKDYTQNINAQYDYESKSTYAEEFNGFRNMFMMLGSALSFVIGLIGILNFFNAILTGIAVREREFAMLQSIGMTGKQLKTMLIIEGLLYTLSSIIICLILSVTAGPLMGKTMEGIYWFFTYKFTLTPVLLIAPIFAILGIFIPLASYRSLSKSTIVERLRVE